MFKPSRALLQKVSYNIKPYKNMLKDPSKKYSAFKGPDMPERKWPNNTITKAPRWLSTDLRDGNQSLPDPMSISEKKLYFKKLVEVGFKEIEVSFPSASQTDFDFTRFAVETAPDDVAIQVLTQSREHLVRRTVESVTGAKKAIIHVYLATSDVFRDIVFNMSKEEAVAKAVETTKLVRSLTKDDPTKQETEWSLEFSPECFSDTPTDFAVEICEAVKAAWEPTVEQPIIFNLPATVEVASPNIYADQIEYFCNHISEREKVCVSVHPHNDRGCGVAASELGLMAGADRVEGCLFGNGERTEIIAISEKCNKIPTHPRAPYGGSLVVSAFSGSHQDAIKKGFLKVNERKAAGDESWKIPYLPLDPKDIGRNYEAVIRVNSQSGKGGAAWVILRSLGMDLPRTLQVQFSSVVQDQADKLGRELKTEEIVELFGKHYMYTGKATIVLEDYTNSKTKGSDGQSRDISAVLKVADKTVQINGQGNGPISAFISAVAKEFGMLFEVVNYNEHSLGTGTQDKAATYIEVSFLDSHGQKATRWGCGVATDTNESSFKAIISILNGLIRDGEISV
ncbi:hypothetical protein JCM33374_g1224 [Metschnikowia sp. JCM 33374]|nr:hypothetical protein JCM33374_g1224 [Metschnikowia sp. JCM 33374]